MRFLLTVCTALLAAASLPLTYEGAARSDAKTGFLGGLCFALALPGALVLGVEEKYLLLASLVLLCAARPGKEKRA